MSIPRKDLITDTRTVLDIVVKHLPEALQGTGLKPVALYLVGSKLLQHKFIDIHASSKPTPFGDVDIFILTENELTKRQNEDFKMFLSGFFRCKYNAYVCSSLGKQLPHNNQLIKEY